MAKTMPNINTPGQEEFLLKIIIIGDSGVGKTNILFRYCENSFRQDYTATIGVDFKVKTVTADNKRLKLQIWDTAGQQRYRNITQAYYKGAAGIILTYSITDAKTFQNIERWIKQIHEYASADISMLLVGNKLDAEKQREVEELQGRTLATKYHMNFMEVSAKDGAYINEAFESMADDLAENYLPKMQKQNAVMYARSVLTDRKTQVKTRQGCQC